MAKMVYMVTYDFDLYCKPDIWDREYKKYDKKTGYFIEMIEKPKYLDSNIVQIDVDIAQAIMKNIIHSDNNKLLEPELLKWYTKFQQEAKKRPSLLKNKDLLFNYLVLKAMMAGLPEVFALTIYATYMTRLEEHTDGLIDYDKIIENLDAIINKKTFWVPDISQEVERESMLIDDVIRKRSTSPDYNFDQFEKRYLKLCNEGYIKKVMEYNRDSTNLYSKGISFEEQKKFLLHFFSTTTMSLIDIIASNYDYFNGNFASKKALHDNMKRTLEYAMRFWE